MKIEIEFDDSYNAKLVIDGRELRVVSKPGIVTLKGIKSPETDNTLGGIIASELYGLVSQIQQAWAIGQDYKENLKAFEPIDEDTAEDILQQIW